ncbi:hypothetical protein [Nonomuraea sp. NPDC049141]|uniref:hypothetical protein n=1 Tax=Nonomuraea sp. NPDC049141 TaxID=3155500 RepID=UPI0033F5DEEF
MKVTDKYENRVITLEMTEDEAKLLNGLLVWFPTDSGENRTYAAQSFAMKLSDLLDDNNVRFGDRTSVIRNSY